MRLEIVDRLAELPYRMWAGNRLSAPKGPTKRPDLDGLVVGWPTEYQWAPAANIVETVRQAFRRLGVLQFRAIRQDHKGVIMLECQIEGRLHNVALDYSDYPDFINESALSDCGLYVKLQWRKEGYQDSRIIPGGYPVTGLSYYSYYLPFRRRYANNREHDVVGRFGYKFNEQIRRKAVALLSEARDIDFVGSTGKVRYSRFLKEAASSRLCLHMPGNGPFTHRVAEFLGLGTCMVSIRFATDLHVPLEAGVHYVEIAEDLSDLVEKCQYYITHDEERERIASAGADYFDRNLNCDQLASYQIRCLLDRLGSSHA